MVIMNGELLNPRSNLLYLMNKNILPMAGLWSTCSYNGGETILSYTIITKKADKKISQIHNRMPLIIDFNRIVIG